nr:DUF1565 domain-containing protein [Lachnospiraceae bacterium]
IVKEYTIVASSLKDRTEMTVSNVVYQNKAGICKPAITVTDKSSGKVLKAGTDYKKPEKYYYHNATTVTVKNSNTPVLRAAGDEVGSKDIIPVNTVIDFTIKGINNYVGADPSDPDTVSGSFRIIDKKRDLSQAKITIKPRAYTGKQIGLTYGDVSFSIAGEKCDLVLHKDFDILYDLEKYDYTKKGTHKVVIRGLSDAAGSGYFGEKTVSFEIKAKALVEKTANTKQLYVSVNNGDDTNVGSEEAPFKTIQKALNVAKAGTQINIADGTYDEMLTFEKSGDKDSPITLRGTNFSLDEEGHIVYGAKLTYTKESDNITLIDINGQSNIVIDGLDIGNITAHTAEGIFMPLNSKNITVSHCKIHDIKVLNEDDDYNENGDCANAILCLGEGNTVNKAIDNIVITNCEVCGNVTNWSESVSFAGNVSNVGVMYNSIHDNSNIGIDFNGNTGYCSNKSLDQPRYCYAEYNEVYNCRSNYAYCAGIYIDGARDIRISNNTVYGCDYGIEVGAEIKNDKYPVTNITVKANEIKDNYHGGIVVGGYDEKETGIVKDSVIFDNVLESNVKDADSAEIIINRCSNIGFFSNDIIDRSSKTNDVTLILSEMDEKNTFGLSFRDNQYYSAKSKDDLHFVINGKEIVGFDEFTQTVGADDLYINIYE